MKKLLIVCLLITPCFAQAKDSSLRRIAYHRVVKPAGHVGCWMVKKLVG